MPSTRLSRLGGALAALALGLLPATPADASSANTAALQVAMKALHHYDGAIDGVRNSETTKGLRVFQKAHHLTADGIVGADTLRALGWRGRASIGERTVKRSHKGWDVAAIQFMLARRGFSPGSVDGGFGQLTDTAVHQLQRSVGLRANGEVDSDTLDALIHGGSSSDGGSSGAPVPDGDGSPGGPIRFYRPVDAAITSPFGMRWGRMHTGVDFGAPAGAPIESGGVGTVSFAGWNSGGYGNLVIVQHDEGYETWYAHMSRVAVHAGEAVNGGSLLGYVGATGHVTGPHLHFEVRQNGTPMNPLSYLLSGMAKLKAASAPEVFDADGCAPPAGPGKDPRTARLGSCGG